MKTIKRVAFILLLIAMAYASNWDLPKETRESWKQEHKEELEAYEEAREIDTSIEINGEIYEGQYIDSMWYEALEFYGGAIPDELLEGEDDEH